MKIKTWSRVCILFVLGLVFSVIATMVDPGKELWKPGVRWIAILFYTLAARGGWGIIESKRLKKEKIYNFNSLMDDWYYELDLREELVNDTYNTLEECRRRKEMNEYGLELFVEEEQTILSGNLFNVERTFEDHKARNQEFNSEINEIIYNYTTYIEKTIEPLRMIITSKENNTEDFEARILQALEGLGNYATIELSYKINNRPIIVDLKTMTTAWLDTIENCIMYNNESEHIEIDWLFRLVNKLGRKPEISGRIVETIYLALEEQGYEFISSIETLRDVVNTQRDYTD